MKNLNFDKFQGLIPAIVQDYHTRQVLMLGFMNEEAYQKTLAENKVTFYSRSQQSLWTKGETSGNFLDVVEIRQDCDADTLLIRAIPRGPVCHKGSDTCFDEVNEGNFMDTLEKLIHDYRQNPKEGSYTSSLFKKGINKIAQKVGEEAVELIIEAKDEDADLFKNEAADLMYHFLVLLSAKGFRFGDIVSVLEQRHRPKEEKPEKK